MAHVAARTPLPRLAPALIRAAAPALARYASSAAGGPAAAPWTQRELDFVRARLVPPTPVPPRPWATEEEARRHAAVLVPLCNVGGEAAVLFTVRSAGLRNHRSEVRSDPPCERRGARLGAATDASARGALFVLDAGAATAFRAA